MKILLTGANGYIGRRLLPVLVESGHEVICVVRDKNRFHASEQELKRVSVIQHDFLNNSYNIKCPQIDVAFYLLHSLSSANEQFETMERTTAHNFLKFIPQSDVKQIIYLGGIYNDQKLSKHLSSRLTVENILKNSNIPTTVLRAGIVIGSGGASFEIIRDLVEKLPVMIAPSWLRTKSQPIAIANVIEYLAKSVGNTNMYNKVYDIGGPEVLSYKEMLIRYAKFRGLRRLIISIPLLFPHLSSIWVYFVTSTSFNICRNLVESMKNEIIARDSDIQKIIPTKLLTYEESLERAFSCIQQNEVISSWTDAYNHSTADHLIRNYVSVPEYGCFKDIRTLPINDKDSDSIFQNITSIGGQNGWYSYNFLWQIRGLIDKMFGGVGANRGRKNQNKVKSGETIDFWRVLLVDEKQKRMLLFAEMKVPGEAWLEFKITKNSVLMQTATFRPHGLIGRIYWYSVIPFHNIIFKQMIRRIAYYKDNKHLKATH